MDEWRTEWAVEVTWTDWRDAGAPGPTSQFGPFGDPDRRDQFLARMRRDREIAATRVLARRAAYTAWEPVDGPVPTSEQERQTLLADEWERINWGVIRRDCTAVGFSGEGRCIETAEENGLCSAHNEMRTNTTTRLREDQ